MARGRATRSTTLAPPAPSRRPAAPGPEDALILLASDLAALAARLPRSRLAWIPELSDGAPRLGERGRAHEALVRAAGARIEEAARALALAPITRLGTRVRALDAALARNAHGAADPRIARELSLRRAQIMEHDTPAVRQRALWRALRAARAFGPPAGSSAVHRYEAGSDAAASTLVESVCGVFPRAWLSASRADSALVPLAVRLGPGPGRQMPAGWHGSYEHALPTSTLRLDEKVPASPHAKEWAAHELTHRMEALVPGLDRLAWAYRERVREGEAPAPVEGYAMREYDAADPTAASETLACAVQALAGAPEHFARVLGADAGYRHFVLGALALA